MVLHLRKQKLETVEDVREWLHGAIRLELTTLPPYLTAYYSIIPGKNEEAAVLLRSVALEEMLHLCLVCNLLNAVGGHPRLNDPEIVPKYPGPLPMNIGSEPGRQFIVPLKRASIEVVRDIFMVIEEPEDPIHYSPSIDTLPDFHTIGEFYAALDQMIRHLGNSIFTGDPKLQVTGWFPSNELFAITDVASASKALGLIIDQGEGTKITPVCVGGMMAHYYRFEQIVRGKRLVVDAKSPHGYSFTGVKVPFDRTGVFPMVENPPHVPLPRNSLVARYADEFDQTYTMLLNAFHAAFNGRPDQLDTAIGLMYTLRLQAQQLMSTQIPGRKVNAGPRWKFVASV